MTDSNASLHSSAGSYKEPSLDRLVAHFVASKRSLSSTAQVYRANEIAHDARGLIEESAVLGSKNAYVKEAAEEQVRVLRSVGDGLEAVSREAQADFQAVVKSLDVANDRLQATLASLRKTLVSRELASSSYVHQASESEREGASSPSKAGLEKSQKTLHDFIDEATHLNLLDSLRATIDSYNDGQAALHQTRASFDDSLHSVEATLRKFESLHHSISRSSHSESPVDSIPSLFHSISSNASEAAQLLQSLISHYDLCITALKHTEGGGDAARAATSSPTAPDTDATAVEESLYGDKIREPISISEREEMLRVLENDSAEVDDVVLEIRDRCAEMEASLSSLLSLAKDRRTQHKHLARALGQLRGIGDDLPTYVARARSFRATWTELKADIQSRTDELVSLTTFYDSFLAGYASLMREVERRRLVEGKVRKIAERANREMRALYAEDVDMREQFVKDAGEFLPRDIWPGLMDAPVRWEVRALGEEGVEAEREVMGREGDVEESLGEE